MHRLATLILVFVMFAGALALARGNPATAQDDMMTTHPVVGAWRWTIDLGGFASIPALGLFHADGTYAQVFADGSGLVGVWRPTGERTADLTLYTLDLVDDKLATGEARLAIEVDETENTMTSTGTYVELLEDGSINIAVEAPATATRLEVLPVEPLGTPVLPPDMAEAAGTPAS